MAEIIDGNKIAEAVLEEVTQAVSNIQGRPPCVAFIRVGEDPASVSYVKKKQKTASKIGIESRLHELPLETSQQDLLKQIDALNQDPEVDGILVQSPLPAHMDEQAAFNHINPNKDIDGFHPVNMGKICQGSSDGFITCTPAGVIEILKRSQVETSGKHIVVVGRSLIVGKPLALLLMQKADYGNATVTVCHSRTENLEQHIQSADIVIAAIGKPTFITGAMLKEGAVVIDVGINRVEDPSRPRGYKLVGDVDYESVFPKASKITPVPGGVGPMTVAMLMKNTLKAHGKS